MLFNSLTFLIFFICFYLTFRCLHSKNKRVYLITIASYVFYGFWNLPFVILLLGSTILDFNIGRKMYLSENKTERKLLLITSLVFNLGMLFFFKYYNFFIESGINILSLIGIVWTPPLINVILPVGISFYTFQTLSYTIDIYKYKLKPENSIWKFSAFVSFFPQLVAGPILRAKDFLPQFKKNRTFSWEIFYQGFFLILFGLFKKMVIADNLAPYVERVYDNNFSVSFSDSWIATLAFSFQIYMDFSGYSDIAIGLALLLGFYISDNFNSPYAAISFSDFWRRWHISLSSWLRDYLYIPLGGNRQNAIQTNINLMITMLLGGLWHGASWNFAIWGLMHGFLLMMERNFGFNEINSKNVGYVYLRRFVVFIFILFTWVMFRGDISKAIDIFSAMMGFSDLEAVKLLNSENILFILSISILILMFQNYFANKKLIKYFNRFKYRELNYILIVTFLLFFIIFFKGEGGAFIYFQF